MKQNSKPNNKKGNYKPKYVGKKKKDVEVDPQESKMKSDAGDINDSSYYYTDMGLRDQILNFSFNEFLGRPIPYKTALNIPFNRQEYPASLMSFQINPAIAPTGDPNKGRATGINLAGLKNYLNLSSDNAKTTQYGPEDVTGLILALGEPIKLISHASRCFGLLNYFDKRNWTAPRQYFRAMDIDYDDFAAHAADYRIKLNTLIASMDKMPIPMNIEYLKKAGNWFKTVYYDETSPMAQCYMFTPFSTWILDEAGTTGGSVLTTVYVAHTNYAAGDTWDGTFQRILDIIEDQINALLTSSTMQYIFSDLLRKNANGKQELGTLAGVPDGYAIEFSKSDEIRLFIHNMVTTPGAPVDQDWKHELYSNGNTGLNDVWLSAEHAGVIYNPEFYSYRGSGYYNSWDEYAPDSMPTHFTEPGIFLYESLISDYFVEPDNEAKIAATRLSIRGKGKMDVKDGNNYDYYLNDMAFCDAYVVHAWAYTSDVATPRRINTLVGNNTDTISALTDFNLAPIVYNASFYVAAGVPQNVNSVAEIGELNYWTMLDYDFMKRMYEAEMIGLFEMR